MESIEDSISSIIGGIGLSPLIRDLLLKQERVNDPQRDLIYYSLGSFDMGLGKKLETIKKRDIYAEVAGRVDTLGTKINAAETSRVISVFFESLTEYGELEAMEFVLKELKKNRV